MCWHLYDCTSALDHVVAVVGLFLERTFAILVPWQLSGHDLAGIAICQFFASYACFGCSARNLSAFGG